MEPFPLAIGGVVAGWLVRGLGFGAPSIPAPIACSCSCECPSKPEPSTLWDSLLPGLLLIGCLASVVGGAFIHRYWLGWHKDLSAEPVWVPSSSKGKKGLGVVGKTLQLTQ